MKWYGIVGIVAVLLFSLIAGCAVAYRVLRPEPQMFPLDPTATMEPTAEPTPEPTAEPTPEPTAEPTPEPTAEPTPSGPTDEEIGAYLKNVTMGMKLWKRGLEQLQHPLKAFAENSAVRFNDAWKKAMADALTLIIMGSEHIEQIENVPEGFEGAHRLLLRSARDMKLGAYQMADGFDNEDTELIKSAFGNFKSASEYLDKYVEALKGLVDEHPEWEGVNV